MSVDVLVTSDWVEKRLDDPSVRLVEIGSSTDSEVYRAGHLPGTVWWHWKEYCWHETDRQFITPAQMARHLGEAGIGPDGTLVLYGDPVQYGNYAFWTYTMAGHADIRLLDGTRTKWQNEGRPLTTDVPSYPPVAYTPRDGDTSMRVGRDDVLANLGHRKRLLLDMRSPEEFNGERVIEYGGFDHGAERSGRIPGARHLFFKELLNDDDSYKTRAELQAVFNSVGATRDSGKEIVCYCRLSHRASLTWFALTHILGYENVKIYDGSWTEWGSMVNAPIEK